MAAKVIIVTGASRGLGLAIAGALVEASHKVVLTARSGDNMKSLKDSWPGQVEYVTGDMAKFEVCATDELGGEREMLSCKTAAEVARLAISAFGRLDGIVINHGVLSPITRLENASPEEWRRIYDIN